MVLGPGKTHQLGDIRAGHFNPCPTHRRRCDVSRPCGNPEDRGQSNRCSSWTIQRWSSATNQPSRRATADRHHRDRPHGAGHHVRRRSGATLGRDFGRHRGFGGYRDGAPCGGRVAPRPGVAFAQVRSRPTGSASRSRSPNPGLDGQRDQSGRGISTRVLARRWIGRSRDQPHRTNA